MRGPSNRPGRKRPVGRSRLGDAEERLARKKRRRTTGLVEIPGPLPGSLRTEIRHVAGRLERSDPGHVTRISPFASGLAIETSTERLAQRIADALERSRHARVERVFDDEGRRRILTCRVPGAGEE